MAIGKRGGRGRKRKVGAGGRKNRSRHNGTDTGGGGRRNQDLLAVDRMHGARTNLLRLSRGANEADIQDRIAAWLRSEGIDYQLQYRTPTGPIDIHLKHLRCIIEVKRRERLERGGGGGSSGPYAPGSGSGKSEGGESAIGQLTRYVDSLRAYGTLDKEMTWRGSVTDGRRWWVWEWPKADTRGKPKIVAGWSGRLLDMSNIDALRNELTREGSGGDAALPWAPDDPTSLFEPFIADVRAVYSRNKALANTRIQKRLWLEQLKGGGRYPNPADEDDMFVRHTLLIVIARMVSGFRAGPKSAAGESGVPGVLLEGFVGWMENAGDILAQIQSVIDQYDWRANQADVMRTLYMGFIPIEQRKSYGEYYTPDWVAEKMCMEIIDDGYIARQIKRFNARHAVEPVLDPACGSGTFLHHAAMRLRNSRAVRDAGLNGRKLDDFICSMVWGVDLHPVAVEMSVANMARMLPGAGAQRPHVYQGDSMLADAPTATLDEASGNAITLRADGETLTLPRRFVGGIPDAITAFVASAVDGSRLPQRLLADLNGDERDVMRRAHKSMKGIIERNGNGVWGWYIRNQSAPMLLADEGRIGRIVSNAPWVRFSEIRDRERQRKIEGLGKETGVYAGSEMKTALDISAVFVARCNSLYLTKTGRAGWVIPVTAIKGAGQWERLRTKYSGRIRGFWNLGMLPFPKQGPCCVLLYGGAAAAAVAAGAGAAAHNPPVLRIVCHGPRPDDHDGWSGVVSKIARLEPERDDGTRAIITAKSKKPSAWVTNAKKHKAVARQGAILTPSMLVRVGRHSTMAKGGSGRNETVHVETAPSTHGAWKKLGTRSAAVPRSWLRTVILGSDILPFVVPHPTLHILPIGDDGQWVEGRTRRGYWMDARRMYADNCGTAQHTPKTLEGQLDYHGKLSSQFPPAAKSVVYNTSGERLYAAATDGTHIVESSAYRVPCRSQAEADFLAAILNADAMQRVFCETKRSPRHYHTYFWHSIPIPRYDGSLEAHAALAEAGKRARKEAGRICSSGGGPAPARKGVVAGLQSSGLAREIDAAVKKVLPAYAMLKHGLYKKGKRGNAGGLHGAQDRRQTHLA